MLMLQYAINVYTAIFISFLMMLQPFSSRLEKWLKRLEISNSVLDSYFQICFGGNSKFEKKAYSTLKFQKIEYRIYGTMHDLDPT